MNEKILNQIKNCRRQRNISIKELSKRCNVSYSYLLQLEKGINVNPTLNILEKIADVLNLEMTFLIK